MATTFQHKVFSVRVLPQVGQYSDVVYEIDWYIEAREGAFATRYNNTTTVDLPDGSGFIPFDDLTEADVLGWLPSPMTDDLQRHLQEIIAQQQAEAQKEYRPLPWES